MRQASVLTALLLFACSHRETAAAPQPTTPPEHDRGFVDRSRPSGGIRAAAMADIAPAVDAQYRITPDRRALLAVADLHEILAGRKIQPEIDFRDGKWIVVVEGKEIGSLPEMPRFADLVDFLASYAERLGVPSAKGTMAVTGRQSLGLQRGQVRVETRRSRREPRPWRGGDQYVDH